MQKLVNILNQTLTPSIFFIITLFLIFSCSQNNPKEPNASEKKDTLKTPVTIAVKNPIVVHLDTCPPPLTITIPENKKDSFVLKINNSKTVINAPEIKPADFSVLMTNYNTEQGLENSAVQDGCVDKNGNLWFATFGGGISRYDGKSFTNHDIAMGLVLNMGNCIIEDKDKNIWIGTNAGVSRYNGRSFTNYTIAQGLVNNFVNSIFQDKNGNIWFGTNGGISKYNGKSFTNYSTADGLINNQVNDFFQDKHGNIWCGTNGGASRYDGKFFKNYTTTEGLVANYIRRIREDKNGNLWFGGGGVCRMDPNGSFKSYKVPVELTNKLISSIHEDKNGNMWFGTWEGVFRLKEDGSLMKFDTDRGLINNRVNSILEDKAGNLWFCTEDGISRFDQNCKFFTAYTTVHGLTSNSVLSFCEDKEGNLWFGTDGGGVSKLDKDGKTFTNYTTAQGLPHNTVRSMAEDKMGNLWFGTQDGGVCRLDHTRKVFTIYTTSQGLAGNSIRCIGEDSYGNLWFGSAGGGVSQLDKEYKSFTTYTTAQGLSTDQVRDITEDKNGNLWFNTIGGGISRLDKERKYFTNYTTAQGLANNYSWPMVEDKNGNLWIGTQMGLSRFDGKSFINYTKADGLVDNEAGDVIMNKDGVIWLTSNKGLTALKGFAQDKQLHDSSNSLSLKPSNELSNDELKKSGYKPVFEIYGYKTGYPIKSINNIGVTRGGTIWAGTGGFLGDKLIHFDFSNIPINPNPPNAIIQNIKINNEPISWYNLFSSGHHGGYRVNSNLAKEPADSISTAPNFTEEGLALGKILNDEQRKVMEEKFSYIKFDSITPFYPLPVNLVLPYRHNNITFDFTAIEPARPYLLKYQYMLGSYDKEWSPVSDQTSATFGNIHEGKYTFKVKAQSPDGVWSEPVIYTFKVLPPLYRTWWAYTFYVLAFLASLWIFIRWRIKTLKKEKILLEEKVTRRTHELREEKEKVESTLSELKATQTQLIQSEKMASLGELTAGIAHEIQNPLNFVNNFSEINTELIEELKGEKSKAKSQRDEKLERELLDDIAENEKKINHHGKRADAIVKNMLLHSRSSTGKKEPTDVNALTDEYLRLAYHGMRAKDKLFNAKVETDFDRSIEKISVIPQDIGRVILNLINNAFHAVNEKQKQNQAGYEPTVTVGTSKLNGTIEIKVKDNGNGIPQKVLYKIFQPFFTTKPPGQGTGLGLSLAYDIVKAHGGEIKVNTGEGEFTEFVVHLPVSVVITTI